MGNANFTVYRMLSERRKLLVFINPHSGSGKACSVFIDVVAKILRQGMREYDLVITKYAGHARKIARCADLSSWSGVIIVSGDGLLFEVMNGIFDRSDRFQCLNVPFGIVPAGSGNALARSISFANNEPYKVNPVLVSSLNLVCNSTLPMDLVYVENKDQKYCSFLSVGWGMLADIDIDSERLRFIGEPRFTVYALAKILKLRTYKGKLSYLPVIDYNSHETCIAVEESNKSDSVIQMSQSCLFPSSSCLHSSSGRATLVPAHSVPNIATEVATVATEDSFRGDAEPVPNNVGCSQLTLDAFGECEKVQLKETAFIDGMQNLQTAVLPPKDAIEHFDAASILDGHYPVYLTPLDSLVPDTWTTIEGEFVAIYAVYQTHLGTDVYFGPKAKLNDGIIWLTIFNSGITRSTLLKCLMQMSTGNAVNFPGVEQFPVKAFRLEPDMSGKQSHLTVDGEVVEYGPIQAQVMPGAARVMSR